MRNWIDLFENVTGGTFTVYHGTKGQFPTFSDRELGTAHGTAPINMRGFNFTDDPECARTFGPNVLKCEVTISDPYVLDAKGKSYSDFKHVINERLPRIKKQHDGIIIKNYADAGVHGDDYITSNHYIPFNSSQIKILGSDLTEKYQAGFSGIKGAEVAIYRNPTTKEWKDCDEYGEVRAFIVGDDVLVWNPFTAVHQMVRDHLSLGNDAISVSIGGMFRNEAYINVTDNTRNTPWHHNPEVIAAIRQCAFIRTHFTSVEIGFYDEAIVGPWDDLVDDEDEELTEAAIPQTDYGYWITDEGKIIPVGHEQHDEVSRANGGGPLGYAIDKGWIRIVVEPARQYVPLSVSIYFWCYRLNSRSFSALSRLCRSYAFERYVIEIKGVEADESTTLYSTSQSLALVKRVGFHPVTEDLLEARRGLAPLGEMRARVFWNPLHSDLVAMLAKSNIGDVRGSLIRTKNETLVAIWPARILGHWNFHNECWMREGIEALEKIDFRATRDLAILEEERYWKRSVHYQADGFFFACFPDEIVPELDKLFGPHKPVID